MVRLTGLALAGIALGLFVAPQAWADTIPARRADASADAGRVKERLAEVGVAPERAEAVSKSLTPDDLAYFARDPESVQVVGGLWLEEWLLPAAFLGMLGALAIVIIDDTQK